MTVSAEVIADSISAEGHRLTTMVLEDPRFIHSEFMTHAAFSRNASSSRAIPVERMHRNIRANPALPHEFRMNEPGMQGFTVAPPEVVQKALKIIARHREMSIETSEALAALGLHKQHVNRYTEAHQHIRLVVTATDWQNFFGLRDHEAADPTMTALARVMKEAYEKSVPQLLEPGQWHLPFVDVDVEGAAMLKERWDDGEENRRSTHPWYWYGIWRDLIKLSVARCARVSYNNYEGRKPTQEEDFALYDRLVGAAPIHASPAGHQGTPDKYTWRHREKQWLWPQLHGNFKGWRQWRKHLENENLDDPRPHTPLLPS